ncbi:hypothetical protein [Caulobacter vibrioides]|uniref:Uncharacterized protein n=2 Tax=Caulobacter vibrioides TaxID=155892 RepID=Q9A9F8_CAUVC|nr:hypothetical protein [Caulobacter vibrioides]YP_002516455.1 hypothetical protein CCNA_01082 [Caulobacter vibrioides NA1000]AAK23014.1 hypothetical protein CC_1030 [Caulobacter vibrioides CB15]ACL94547.1 hypothetical protein CCNA_01082 [Caulobacter vibrioides NA1000]ATC27863.1 hypothetical protein CA607_05485 [Caulobacter vibrioides]QXZ53108.1 hypothetical protein KZH45_05400 [Caulobacter vibrioides]
MGMSRSHPDARPTWFRLSDDSWAQIADEYKNGATADALSAKWKVAARTIYRRAGLGGWTKKAHGDTVAREHAAAFEAQAEAARRAALGGAGPLPGELWLTGDEDADAEALNAFDPAFAAASGRAPPPPSPLPPPPPLSTDPSDLKAATLARLAAAIQSGRDQEALRLATLADRLTRLASADEEGLGSFPGGGAADGDEPYDAERARLLMTGFVDWRPTRAQVEHETAYMFRSIYLIALAMLVKPDTVPGLFKRRVRRFRRDYLGEDDPEALEAAEIITEALLREQELVAMDFTGGEPRPARKLPARTWPPPRPPYPSRKDLAKEATPLPPAEPPPGAVRYGRRR